MREITQKRKGFRLTLGCGVTVGFGTFSAEIASIEPQQNPIERVRFPMLQVLSAAELAVALEEPIDLQLDLPDPADARLSEAEFLASLDRAWRRCNRLDLQAEIGRGRILRAVRDREILGGTGFAHWLQAHDFSKTRAYRAIQLADGADELLAAGVLDPQSLNNFSKAALLEMAKAEPDVRRLVGEAAKDGESLTQQGVKAIAGGWVAMQSELLPLEIVEKAQEGLLPPPCLAPLVEELEKLPPSQVETLQMELQELPEIAPETVATVTAAARDRSEYWGAATRVRALAGQEEAIESALEEALDLGHLSIATELLEQAATLEQLARKLQATQQRLTHLHGRLWEQVSAETPQLQSLLAALTPLATGTLTVPLEDGRAIVCELVAATDPQ